MLPLRDIIATVLQDHEADGREELYLTQNYRDSSWIAGF